MSDGPTSNEKIKCEIDGALVHSIELHIKKNQPDWTLERYKKEFPTAPLMSEMAKNAVLNKRKELASQQAEAAITRKPMSVVFGIPSDKVKNARGEERQVRVMTLSDLVDGDDTLVPEIDDKYVFPIENTSNVLMGLELRKTIYNWGLHGTGKTTLFEQICARTGRPFLRVQHTIGTEESHVLGQYVVRQKVITDKAGNEHVHSVTEFNLGPLPMAMLNGWVYCADEYDAAIPAVSILYQPVLEGKALYIKDAPPEFRMVRPHPNFRFVATGNTNGSGDETGLYQGTQIQNAANYSRFNMTIESDYAEPKIEAAIIAGQAGIKMPDASKLVELAVEWRKQFRAGAVSLTVSTRELIEAASIGIIRGGNWHLGMELAFTNRLTRTDKEVAKNVMQRFFGNARAA